MSLFTRNNQARDLDFDLYEGRDASDPLRACRDGCWIEIRQERFFACHGRRVLKARRKAAREGRELLPKDLFDLRGFVIAGTDNACYSSNGAFVPWSFLRALNADWWTRKRGTAPVCISSPMRASTNFCRKNLYAVRIEAFRRLLSIKCRQASSTSWLSPRLRAALSRVTEQGICIVARA